MFPPARLTDPVTHDTLVPAGTIVGPCMPTVMIEFLPAARMTDLVICSGATSPGVPVHPPTVPPIPPVPIVVGNPRVLTGFLPQARWVIDITACGSFLGYPPLLPMRRVFVGV